MKKILAIFGILALFASCQTEMELTDSIDSYKFEESYESLNMEFIGFKAGDAQWDDVSRIHWGQMKTTEPIRNFGSVLQNSGIATDASDIYVGVYSFEELQKYKSKCRYVTYVEIPDFQLKYKNNMTTLESGAVLCMFIFLAPIGLPLLCVPAKTNMYFKTSANIFVYDTQENELVYKKTVFITEEKTFKGLFGYGGTFTKKSSEAGEQKVYAYWANVIANKALEEYANIGKSPLFQK